MNKLINTDPDDTDKCIDFLYENFQRMTNIWRLEYVQNQVLFRLIINQRKIFFQNPNLTLFKLEM